MQTGICMWGLETVGLATLSCFHQTQRQELLQGGSCGLHPTSLVSSVVTLFL